MAGIYGSTIKDFANSSRVKSTDYDYSSIKTDGESKKYYGFTIKEHYDAQARNMQVSNLRNFLDLSIKAQRKRENQLLTDFGFTGSFDKKAREFAQALLSVNSNVLDAINDIDINKLFQEGDNYTKWKPVGKQDFQAILDSITDKLNAIVYKKDFTVKQLVDSSLREGKIDTSGIKKALSQMYTMGEKYDVKPQYKTQLVKELNSIIKPLKGEMGEVGVARALATLIDNLNSQGKMRIDLTGRDVRVTGKALSGMGKQVKTDVRGHINLQSKNYTIKDAFKPTPISLHGGSINSLGEYLQNYSDFTTEDMDNFIFNFVNIYNFTASGGVNDARNGEVNYSEKSFDQYENILRCVRQAAAIWFGSVIGLNKKGKDVFKGNTYELLNVDFLVVGSNAIVPVSEILEYLQTNVNNIEVHFDKKYSVDPLEVYQEKRAALQTDRLTNENWGETKGKNNYFNYPEPIRRVGNKYGRMAAFATANVKFMFILNDFKKYSSL